MLLATIIPFDWSRLLWSEDAPPLFLLEIGLRCVLTYLMVLGALRVTGRRGVRQLSIFELSIILALGSAAGDTMLYHDTPLLHALTVFVVISGLYWAFNHATEKMPRFSDWLEGKPVLLIEDGRIVLDNIRQQNLTQKELFGELRQYQVEHLGQVRRAYIESTGDISVYFYPDEDVRAGLPIWPERLQLVQRRVADAGPYACGTCGQPTTLPKGGVAACAVCQQDQWIPSCAALRVS